MINMADTAYCARSIAIDTTLQA